MAKGREVRAFDYVNHPFDRVRAALVAQPLEVFRAATRAAASRARDVVSGLHVNIGGLEIGAEIAIEVKGIEEKSDPKPSERSLHLQLEWEAARAPRLFPLMRGTLSAYPLTSTETQLDFDGRYQVPLGPVGSAMDGLVGHQIAEASVHRFVTDVAAYLRKELA